ncbi:MAG: radical SAM protein [Candidatus Omnitrophica bacterium]|nr:radical SAM protein [Candidatus Omnitrophota bacterium]
MSIEYSEVKQQFILPRLPLEGSLDLTYRCNNNCRHCWLRVGPDAKEAKNELSLAEIKKLVSDAKKMGCRRWSISGGEPMLRKDFTEIFEYITSNANSYSINTNGALITPKIAKLLKKKGAKMVAIYGATAEVHDRITRNPGSFEQTMRGFRYLKEAGAGFIVQLIPMRDNYHQFQEMVKLAESLSKHYRVGAAWLYLSACADKKINEEIIRQRLPAKEVIELDKPDLSYEDQMHREAGHRYCHDSKEEYLFGSCVAMRRDFHVDPYGGMTFCCFLKDPKMRYDLRKGTFEEGWENFIPSLGKKIKVTKEYEENCGSCAQRQNCRICPVYSYLEHGRYDAKIDYLCDAARENEKFKEDWIMTHRRYFNIADITIQVEADVPMDGKTFHPKFNLFATDKPGKDIVSIRHHFSLPELKEKELGKEFYRKPPWAVYKNNSSWIYLGISPQAEDKSLHRVAVFNHDHTSARIYNTEDEYFRKGDLHSLTLFPTDQILIARILADRQGCYLHACGVDLNGKGLLFVGHSEAGKTTMANILKDDAQILCDDRIIVRKCKNDFKAYGTWSHGDCPTVSGKSVPLTALLFLEKAKKNRLIPLKDKNEATKRVLSCLIKPFVTTDWWDKTLVLVDDIVENVPCYIQRFNKDKEIVGILKKL